MIGPLQFGIPSLDALFGRVRPRARERSYDYGAYGIRMSQEYPVTSICFIGPDGTGKSVFGLHLAAQYMADVGLAETYRDGAVLKPWCPRALYVSTDLKHHVAHVMWQNFGLEFPNKRDFPHYWGYRFGRPFADRRVELAKMDPSQVTAQEFAGNLDLNNTKVNFVDLVSRTMGDDWGLINRMVALLPEPAQNCAPHLLIIDAVEGFETLVGEKDAFGETTSRRARIAQIMRTAADKCHVCFIIEEPKTDDRFPEQFVTDVVIRLRAGDQRGYSRRTVEILKARGQSHIRGQHPFVIRHGAGSTTGLQQNADEVRTKQSYVHIFHSLHYLSREEMKARGPANPPASPLRVAAFGVTYLDEMLARLKSPVSSGMDDQGLPAQTTTALIGEIATQKTSLATAFLARTFRAYIFELAHLIRELSGISKTYERTRRALERRFRAPYVILGNDPPDITDIVDEACDAIRQHHARRLREVLQDFTRSCNGARPASLPDFGQRAGHVGVLNLAAWLIESLPETGAAVLITTSNQDRDGLIRQFLPLLRNSTAKALRDWPSGRLPISNVYQVPFKAAIKRHLEQRTICRRMELHDLASPILMQIIQRSVARAQEHVFLGDAVQDGVDRLPYRRSKRFKDSWNVRVVLDDLSTLKDTYPDIGSDPLFLPFLLSFLELEGVTSLIIDSQVGRPDAVVADAFDRELRALIPHKLLTWRVPFYGSIRDAITVVPPFPSGLRSVVREVRWESMPGANVLVVDPELELYSGLDRAEPKPIPLEVRLYAESTATEAYLREENEILRKLFTPVDLAEPNSRVIVTMKADQYDALQDFCNLQTDTLLNYTLVFQVDEFWAINKSTATDVSTFPRGPVARREGALYPLGLYLTEQTNIWHESSEPLADRTADPFGVFQGTPASVKTPVYGSRWERRHYFHRSSEALSRDLNAVQMARIDRIPFTWDFGFLLCPETMWDLANDRFIGYRGLKVGDVWRKTPNVIQRAPQPAVSWRAFLGACSEVAKAHSARMSEPVRALDVSTLAPESLSCLILEMWASEIADSLPAAKRTKFFGHLKHTDWSHATREGLVEWLANPEFRFALYRVWLLLIDSLTLSDLVDRQTIPILKAREAEGAAAATRHWYKTACAKQHCTVTNELMLPVRLPGHFSTRGDWYLAIAGGSRSERLGRRILDFLSSRRANFRRMELGIGLPTRDVSSPERFIQLPTALKKRDGHGRLSAVTYGELIGSGFIAKDDFHWLWRSQLKDYFRHSRLLHKWVAQMITVWEDLRNKIGPQWRSGFDLYDEFEGKSLAKAMPMLEGLESWREFYDMCLLLEEQVNIASSSAVKARPRV